MKKLVSLFLSLVMVFTVLGAITITGSANSATHYRVAASSNFVAYISDDGKVFKGEAPDIEYDEIGYPIYKDTGITDAKSIVSYYGSLITLKNNGEVWGPGGLILSNIDEISAGYPYTFVAQESNGRTYGFSSKDNVKFIGNNMLVPLKNETAYEIPVSSPVVECKAADLNIRIALCENGSIWSTIQWAYEEIPNEYPEFDKDGNIVGWHTEYVTTLICSGGDWRNVNGGSADTAPEHPLYPQTIAASPFDKAHTMYISSDGRLVGAGNNQFGQLGDGTFNDSTTPVYAKDYLGSYIYNPKVISCGFGYTLIIQNDDTVWATGNNEYGKLGTGPDITGNQNVFYPVVGPNNIGRLRDFKDVSAGWKHSVAVKKDGSVWAWGHNSVGQLGNNTKTSSVLPVRVKDSTGDDWLRGIVDVHASASTSMALKEDGTVWMWGNNDKGQLGDGTKTNRKLPVQVKGPNGVGYLTNIKEIATAEGLSMALDDGSSNPYNGYLWTWGGNQYGRLGTYDKPESLYPDTVTHNMGCIYPGAMSAGYYFSAALDDGLLWTWGKNDQGQLGSDNSVDPFVAWTVKSPDGASALQNVKSFACGRDYMVAVLTDGSVLAWGANTWGQFGNGTIGGTYSLPSSTQF